LLEQVYERFEYSGYHPKLIVVGDLLQLPPVEGKYVYESELWKDFTTIKLTTMHRQNEANFIRALGDLRIGKISKRLSKLIKSRTVQQLPDNCTKLFAYRDDVERINISKLNELPGQTMCAQWDIIEGQENADPGKTRFQQKLFLKDGARIVLLTNDKEDRWVNGSTGEVVSIDSEAVHIRLDENEKMVRVLEHQEEVLDADGKSLFMVRQYPIQLAWALTIHKSQGMSMDRVGVNLNGHFASGMTYVAMSRSRTKNGLFLIGGISSIEVNEKALDICK
jgi:ATP-dependent DNA helicase PIF1